MAEHRQDSGETVTASWSPARGGQAGETGSLGLAPGAARSDSAPSRPDPSDSERRSPVGTRLGKYRVARLLGRGGFGEVYLARDEELERDVAIKFARPDRFDPSEQEAFLQEARRLARLDHPGIVRIYQIDRHDGRLFIVSEYIEGTDLASAVRGGDPTPERIADVAAALAEAVAYAHSLGIWHRDLKPSNVLIDRAGKPRLIDFGLAVDENSQRKLAGETAGTMPYMSPEQVNGEAHRLDGRSDIWSLGVILYELLAGSRPFGGDSEASLSEEIRLRDPRPLRMVAPRTPLELARICARCLAKKAVDRYQSAYDLAEDLRNWSQGRRIGSEEGSSRRIQIRTHGDPNVAILPKGLQSFDASDADFFLDLLPGPRDREGLPQRVRFWKLRIQERRSSETFPIGVMYGPSGCGKSSLVKAGILPRLDRDVLPVYVEASAGETEARLLAELRRRCPEAKSERLPALLAELRRNGGSGGAKVLVVLDQFEQWLHARNDYDDEELIRALRQCDGGAVQCLVLVRDDFWMSVSRFVRAAEVELAEGVNSAAVDLFDEAHARKALGAFGRAWEKLPPLSEAMSSTQANFLASAVAGLADDGRVTCVRLVIFAEMMKGRPWTEETLRELGGAKGVQTRFLDEMFTSRLAPPNHRLLAEGAKAVLAALTPEGSVEIRNRTRTYEELFDEFRRASTKAHRPQDFEALLRILTADVRLATVAEPLSGDPSRERRYQLTHDFLVPSLRAWLDRERTRTWQGRTQVLAAERALHWREKRETRHLPSLLEWLSILAAQATVVLAPDQRAMVRAATTYYLVRASAALALAGALAGAGLLLARRFDRLGERREAQTALEQLRSAEAKHLPLVLQEIGSRLELVEPDVRASLRSPDFDVRWRAALALLPVDPAMARPLQDALCDERLGPLEFQLVRDALRSTPSATEWAVRTLRNDEDRRFRAACSLAGFDPQHPALREFAVSVNARLLSYPPSVSAEWREVLRPAGGTLLDDLTARFAAIEDSDEARNAALAIDAFGDGDASEVVALLPAADDVQARALTDVLLASEDPRILGLLDEELERGRDRKDGDAGAADVANRAIANLAVARWLLGSDEALIAALASDEDWPLRAAAAAALDSSQASVDRLLQALDDPRFLPARFGMLTALADRCERLTPQDRAPLLERILPLRQQDPDAGIHSAATLILRRLGIAEAASQGDAADAGDAAGASEGAGLPGSSAPAGWFADPFGFEMIRVQSDARTVAIAAEEVSLARFRQFDPSRSSGVWTNDDDDLPVTMVDALDAVRYCQWLSERSLPADQWCYRPLAELNRENLGPVEGYLQRTGYRLPTPEEWRAAYLAGAAEPLEASDEGLSARYGWFSRNSLGEVRPTGSLLPNRLGFFDLHGNVREATANATDGRLAVVLCGSSARSAASIAFAENRTPLALSVVGGDPYSGFRIARTMSEPDFPD